MPLFLFGHTAVASLYIHAGMDGQVMARDGIEQRLFEKSAVFVVGENRFTIIAPQDNMQRDLFDEVARKTSHIRQLAPYRV